MEKRLLDNEARSSCSSDVATPMAVFHRPTITSEGDEFVMEYDYEMFDDEGKDGTDRSSNKRQILKVVGLVSMVSSQITTEREL